MKPTHSNIQWVDDRLVQLYGPRNRKLNIDPLEELISTILSQNTTDTNRDRAYRSLRTAYPSWNDVYRADRDLLKESIKVAGLVEQKSRAIQSVLDYLYTNHGSFDMKWICREDPWEMIDLFTQIKGIGIKTMSIVLCFACGKDIFPVDTHVNRICKRLGFSPENATPNKTFSIMSEKIPSGRSRTLHLNMIKLGREICKARNPDCSGCVLLQRCPYGQQHA